MGQEFTRQELYDLVWREPLRTLAKTLHISDVRLAWLPDNACEVRKFAQTLKRKCITSPSRTTYSLPSTRSLPASLAPVSPPAAT